MDEDVEMPIILGRSFLDTAGTTIDVKDGKLTLNVGNEKVEFDLNKAMKMPSFDATYFTIDIVDEIIKHEVVDLEKQSKPWMTKKMEWHLHLTYMRQVWQRLR